MSLKGIGTIAEGMKRPQKPGAEEKGCEAAFHPGQGHFTNELTLAVAASACKTVRMPAFTKSHFYPKSSCWRRESQVSSGHTVPARAPMLQRLVLPSLILPALIRLSGLKYK